MEAQEPEEGRREGVTDGDGHEEMMETSSTVSNVDSGLAAGPNPSVVETIQFTEFPATSLAPATAPGQSEALLATPVMSSE